MSLGVSLGDKNNRLKSSKVWNSKEDILKIEKDCMRKRERLIERTRECVR